MEDLSATTPSIDWKMLAEKLLIKGVDSVIVSTPYLKTIDLLLSALAGTGRIMLNGI
jgi:hypothetical protein